MTYGWIYNTPIGDILIESHNDEITRLNFGICDDNIKLKETDILKEAGKQIQEYFKGERIIFDLPFSFNGTKFQLDVWNKLNEIEYGKTITYKELATKIGCPKSYRAVGNANSKNPLPIFIPCHRVVKSNGDIGGYLGSSSNNFNIKKYLIDLEKNFEPKL